MTLPPFTPDATCPKCGSVAIDREGVTINDFARPKDDHHWRVCTRCGYAWAIVFWGTIGSKWSQNDTR